MMKSPKLNREIYIRMAENGQTKDRATQDCQKDMTRATIPLLKSVGEIAKVEDLLLAQKEEKGEVSAADKKALKMVQRVLPIIQKSIGILNYSFTETSRKRKYDACNALGRQFKPFASGKSSDEFLFDEEAMKKMKTELKAIRPKGAEMQKQKYGESSKNYQYSGKSQRGHQQGNYRSSTRGRGNFSNYTNSNSYTNNYTNSSNKQKFKRPPPK